MDTVLNAVWQRKRSDGCVYSLSASCVRTGRGTCTDPPGIGQTQHNPFAGCLLSSMTGFLAANMSLLTIVELDLQGCPVSGSFDVDVGQRR